MPPRRPAPSTRCRFAGCNRNQVRAGLCGRHLELAGAPTHQDPPGLLDVLTSMLNGERIPKQTLEQLTVDAVEKLTGQRMTIEELRRGVRDGDLEIDWTEVKTRVGGAYSRASSHVRSYKRAPMTDEERAQKQAEQARQKQQNSAHRQKASEISKARRILGYTAKEPITREQLKARHRELARKHHPDRGGSTERMQQINWAMDILSQPG